MVEALIRLYHWDRHHPNQWVHATRYLEQHHRRSAANMNMALLRHWEMIEQKPKKRSDGAPSAGFYRITPLGRLFVCGKRTVYRYILTYDERFIGFDMQGGQTTVREALDDPFNYDKLIRGL